MSVVTEFSANLIGGAIVIPYLRRAVEFWDATKNEKQ
jgi:hypothetical protein